MPTPDDTARPGHEPDRRRAVLAAALLTFARYGYRKTSMEQIARDADISRPGLYFLFSSKQELFRAAVEQGLEVDLAAVEATLLDRQRALPERILDAFDLWAGRYVGPLARERVTIIEENEQLLGPVATAAPQRFARSIVEAIAERRGQAFAEQVTQVLVSASIGSKEQAADRNGYLLQMRTAVSLLLGSAEGPGLGHSSRVSPASN